MCGRYSIAIETEDLEEVFGASSPQPLQKRYNAAPLQELPVILNSARRLSSWADPAAFLPGR